MSSRVQLKDLIEALAGAVIDAQDRIEQHQITKLAQYFDDDNRPRTVLIRLPSVRPDAPEGSEDLYRAPLLSLVPSNALKIKDVEIRFDVDLGAIADDAPPDAEATPTGSAWQGVAGGIRKSVQVHTRGPLVGRRSTAHVVLRVEGTEPTDGHARLVNQLTQVQGVFSTLPPMT
ncbi:hypothetical protein CDN99_25515 [Roseateles aquatilis]|uniref:DUF2589 domain-containing protein n=1 Tax=Roseateles aquatilis TaxID=431061 RepID=A0A246IUY8_9BURK|nr:DUF2589 domain-containing protein [Roseateles aquatilis]OWQ83827.1 hypothetical protein CDN99_25515 [Roseateles aquatilis]